MAKTMTMFAVCHDLKGEGRFEPLSCMMTTSKGEAMKDLRTLRSNYPGAYLAAVTYTRIEPAKKGR